MWWKKNPNSKPKFQIGFMAIRSWKSNFNVKAPDLLKDRIKRGKKNTSILYDCRSQPKIKKNQAFWKNPNQEYRKSTSHNSINFLTKILAKPKLFLGGYLFIGENQMSKCLSSVDHNGNKKKREKMEKKNNEGKEDWLEFYKLTILPLVMWKTRLSILKKK